MGRPRKCEKGAKRITTQISNESHRGISTVAKYLSEQSGNKVTRNDVIRWALGYGLSVKLAMIEFYYNQK
jgi:hypothetical protein